MRGCSSIKGAPGPWATRHRLLPSAGAISVLASSSTVGQVRCILEHHSYYHLRTCKLFGACGCYSSCSSTGRVNRSIQVIYVDDASTRVEGSGFGSGGVKAKEEAGGEGEEEGGGKTNG